MTGVIVCRPAEFLLRRIAYCPTCNRRRRFAGRVALWYGATWMCCGCGDSWTDGERHARPFRRGWRIAAIAAAKETWEDAADFDRADLAGWFRAQLGGEGS